MIRYNTKRYWGYSTDTKPINAQIGDRFLEMDTQLEYVFSDYNKWELIGLNFTGGTVTGATIFTSGLTATTISATTYQNLPRIQNVVTVGLGGNVDFTSIKLAVDSITGSSSSNQYVVQVFPGVYLEDEIDLTNKQYVSIVGSSIETVFVEPNTPTQHLFRIGQYNELSFFTINNIGVGYSAIYCDDIGDYGQAHKLAFNDCDTNITILSSTQDTKFFGEYLDFNGSYSYGVKIIASNGYLAYANMENYYNYPTGTGTTIANLVQGSGATLSVFVGDGIGNGVSGSTNYQISDYASLNTISTTSDSWDYGVRVLNVGGPSRFDIDSLSIVNSLIWDLSVEHPGTFGTFGGGSASHTKINNLSNDVYWAFLDIEDGEFDITRKISITFQDGTHTDASTLIFKGGTMGLMSGGTISVVSGLTVNVSSGFGYLQKTTSDEVYMRIDWVSSNITLLQNVNEYLYYNENEILSTSGSRPDSVNNIILGRVVTNSSTVSFIDDSPLNADHTSNRYGSLFREALGPIYAFGSIVTEGTTAFTLNVTSGEYYYSTNEYLPTGGSGLTFNQYYRDGLGGWNISATTLVNNTQFDNNGTLSGLTSSAYTKHTLYLVGDGVNEKYFLVLGQNQYQTLVETENALLPEPPSYFTDAVTQIANIYIKQGLSGITEIEDIRPVIGFKAGGINASSLHANLLGLTSDDHKQYLLVDGSRAMSNNLNMGGNAIVSALTVNGVTVESHASRHQNGGADEIATSTPSASAIPKADTFGKLDGWISDASSTVKGLTRLSVNPLSAATPIAVGINDTRFLKTITGVTNTLGSLIFSNNSGETTSFSGLTLGGLTATTISATTYQNLPATPFLPLSGGTLTGPLVIQYDFNPLFIRTTNFSPGSAGNILYYGVFTGSTNGFSLNSRSNGGGASGNLILQSLGNGNVGVNKNTTDVLNYNLDVNGSFGATSVSATTYFNLPTDIRVTGGTYSNGTATFTNNTGGTFNVTGLYTGGTDVFVTGATKSGDVATFTNNTGGTFTLTGLTDTFVTGGTYSGSTIIFTNSSGGTFDVTGITTSSAFTGGTVSGATIFTGGLTADTISATTITSPSISPYGLIVATSIGYQNIF
jgi:hypothetical protein